MKHTDFFDFLEYKTLEKPLPCNCENCMEKIRNWEKERERIEKYEGDFHFQKGEKMILEKVKKRFFPLKAAITFGFSLILIFGLFALSNIKKTNKIRNFDSEYSKIMDIYQRPDLGDLEACSIIFENNNKEDL